MGVYVYDRPKDGEATREQLAAWDKGYRASEDGNAPSLGGLYRGEERYYIAGFNRSRFERGELLVRLSPLRSGGYDLVEEEKPKDIPTGYVPPAGEVRTTSSTGGMKGVKPERFSLLPVEALNSVARLYAFGAVKYAAHNWRKGYEWTKSYDSLMRHATQSLNGEDYDEETGEPHLAGVVFHAFTLMCYLFDYERYGHFDDRFKHEDLESEFEGSDEEIAGQENIPMVGTRLTEIEPMQPTFNVRSMMVTIPTVVGAVYYLNDKHVVGSFQVRSTTEIKAVALPGYRFSSDMDKEWTFIA